MAHKHRSSRTKAGTSPRALTKRPPSTESTASSGETIEIVRPDFDMDRSFPHTRTSNARLSRPRPHWYDARNIGYNGVYPGSFFSNPQSRLFRPPAFSHGGMRSIFDPSGALSHHPFSGAFGTMSPFHLNPPSLWNPQSGRSAFDFGHSSVWPRPSWAARDMHESDSARPSYEPSASASRNRVTHPEWHVPSGSELPPNVTMRMRASVMTHNHSASDRNPKRTYRETTAAYNPRTGWHAKTKVGDESGFRTYVWP